jgi:hypothetical protein
MTIANCTNSITSTRRWPRSMRAIADCGLPMRAATSRWRRPALMRYVI